jgi:hypothetical protein
MRASLPAALVMHGGTLVCEPQAASDLRPSPAAAAPPRRCDRPGDLDTTPGDAYLLERRGAATVIEARVGGQPHRLALAGGEAVYRGPRVRVYWRVEDWTVSSAEPVGQVAEGERIDLGVCATLIALAAEAPPAQAPTPAPG